MKWPPRSFKVAIKRAQFAKLLKLAETCPV